MGVGKAFDPSRFFIFCANVMGSPYGSASPVTINPHTGLPYGPEFPLTTIRDDVKYVLRHFSAAILTKLPCTRAHKMVLDSLGVRSVAVVVGGSMGGMAVLEWPLCHPQGYVRHIIPLATSARHSAWCISWSEAQRQSIYSDPNFQDGYYTPESQPKSGLAAARMAALLTYRSRDSFESRFGRRPQLYRRPSPSVNGNRNWNGNGVSNSLCVQKGGRNGSLLTPPASPAAKSIKALVAHNEGNRNSLTSTLPGHSEEASANPGDTAPPTTTIFSAQSYLRYQGDKFTARFDANCYIHITRKMDTHDVSRDRLLAEEDGRHERALARILSTLPKGALVIGVETDGLFTPNEQEELAAHIPNAELVMIQSKDGHDGFLLEFEEINRCGTLNTS